MRRGGNGQRGFAEAFLGADVGSNRKLESISAQLDWDALGALVDGLRPGRTGRPPYAPLVMVRVLLLQQWYGLSDVEVCKALADRLSFRRFCGLSLDEATPDDTTLCRFRTALGQAALARRSCPRCIVSWTRAAWCSSAARSWMRRCSPRRWRRRPRAKARSPTVIRKRRSRPAAVVRCMATKPTWPPTRAPRWCAACRSRRPTFKTRWRVPR